MMGVVLICPVCWWENDVFIKSDNEPSDENRGMTLNQERANYKKCGIANHQFITERVERLDIGWNVEKLNSFLNNMENEIEERKI